VKCLGLLRHLAGKTWATREVLARVIDQIALARGWDIHR
jgi:hypothetical protein